MKILISDKLSEKGIEILKNGRNIEVDVATELTKDELAQKIAGYDALVIRSKTKVTKDILANADRLKVIGRAGVGVDNVDIPAASKKGIIVMNTPGGNTISAAEHTMSLIMAMARNIPSAHQSMKEDKWEKKKFMGTELYGKTLGILGLGRIGSEVARRALSFGMVILAYDPHVTEEYALERGVRLVSREEVLGSSDFITLHMPSSPETKGMINQESIAKMKDGVRIVNCARGDLIEESAVLEGLKSGKIRNIALDVFQKEPPEKSELLKMERVILTPHLGASTEEAQVNVAVEIANQILKYFEEGIVMNAVNMPPISAELYRQLKPYLVLSEKLGSFISQISDGAITEVKIEYSGDILQYDLTHLTVAVLKGIFQVVLEEEVNYVNAPFIARERGIRITESRKNLIEDFAHLISVEVITGKSNMQVAGTLFGKMVPRLVRIGDFYLDAVPEGNILLCENLDRPGVIGKIGSVLGDKKINISAMQVGKSRKLDQALIIINADSTVPDDAITAISDIQDVLKVRKVVL